jgi:dihydrofolate reductase
MSLVTLYIAASLDGKIARTDGGLDWLTQWPNPNQIDHGYEAFLRTIGTTLMGKKTYLEILGFGVDWPYTGMDSYVVTTDPTFQASTPNTQVVTSNLAGLVQSLKRTSDKDIWLVGGGQLIASFLGLNLLDRMILTVVPITLGKGIPLFPDQQQTALWKLTGVEPFETGLVNLTYDRG